MQCGIDSFADVVVPHPPTLGLFFQTQPRDLQVTWEKSGDDARMARLESSPELAQLRRHDTVSSAFARVEDPKADTCFVLLQGTRYLAHGMRLQDFGGMDGAW